MSPEQMKKLKDAEVEMLDQLIKICDKLNIRYYLIGGTLLGAIRHKGFIPWDDDIDIGMLRDDYKIFVAKAQDLLPNHIFLQNYMTDKYMIFSFTKLRNSNTTYIEKRNKNSKMNQGVWIDVFPLDYYESLKIKRFLQEICIRIANIRIGEEQFFEKSKTHGFGKKQAKAIGLFIVKKLFPSLADAVKFIDKMYSSAKPGEIVLNKNGSYGKREEVPKAWFEDTCQVEFEGMKVNAPIEYDKYLHQIYGDYMIPPPIEKQVSVHDIEIVDMDKSYSFYI